MVSEYKVQVHPDGSWRVEWLHGCAGMVHSQSVNTGAAPDQRRGEIAARMAIEDHKAERAKDRIEAKGVLSFTVKD